jgi:hypothetical protein
MPVCHFFGRTAEGRKAPAMNPRRPVEQATNPRSLTLEFNGFSALIQDITRRSPVQIPATATPSRKPRLMFTFMSPGHNAPQQRPRATGMERKQGGLAWSAACGGYAMNFSWRK